MTRRLTTASIFSLAMATALLIGLAACRDQAGDRSPRQAADLLLTNARVYSMAWGDPAGDGRLSSDAPHDEGGWRPDASAIGIRDGKIIYVGDGTGIATLIDGSTEQRDLNGATVVPGLVDTHSHLFELGALLERVNLIGVETEAEAVALIAEQAKQVPPGQWIIGHGWDEGAWADRYPDKSLLSEAVPDHPVFMRSLHSFAGWANQSALDRAGINADSVVPSGGEMRLDNDGQPNGLFLNRAVPMLEDQIPPPDVTQQRREIDAAMVQMIADGYTTVHDAGLESARLALLQELEDANALPLRIYAMVSVRDERLAKQWLERGPDTDSDSPLVTRSIKAYYDGALGSRGARLIEEYYDQPGHYGVSGSEYGFNQQLTEELMAAGFQVAIHAIGDAGNRETLDFLAGVFERHPQSKNGRHRIEHAQVIHPDDLPRLGAMGIIASMEPPHAMEDKAWAEQRLGPERIKGAYAWRSLRKTGASLTFNADNPGSDHSIFYGLHSAVTRTGKDGQPVGGWYPEQAMNIDEAMRGYTRWAAYAGFREQQTGTIELGKWADLTVMDIDPFVLSETEPAALLSGSILMTIIDGKLAYEATAD